MRGQVSHALQLGDLHGACVALVQRSASIEPPSSAMASPVALLAWLRSPAIDAAFVWTQDRVLSTDQNWFDPDVIASENQSIWLAHLPGDADATYDPAVEIRLAPAAGIGRAELLFEVPLSELLLRMLLSPELFRHRLRCRDQTDLDGSDVLPDRKTPGATSVWGPITAGTAWVSDGADYFVDELPRFVPLLGDDWSPWEQHVQYVSFSPRVAVRSAYEHAGGWNVRHKWVPVSLATPER